MIGDRASDMQAAQAAGVGRWILLTSAPGESAAAPPGTLVLPGGALETARQILFPEIE